MNQPRLDLTDEQKAVAEFIRERDWEQFHSPKNLSMSIAIEAAELMEHFQWTNTPQESQKVLLDPKKHSEIKDELADIAIYLLDFCNLYQIDLKKAIQEKLAKNIQKYPVALSKGKSHKYTAYQEGKG